MQHVLILNLVLSISISLLAFKLRLLRWDGALAAMLVGFAVLLGAGLFGGVVLMTFFVSSNLLGRLKSQKKASLDYEKGGPRDSRQVFANGGLAAAFALLGLNHELRHISVVVFATALAESNADTWATELGSAIGGVPRSIVTLRPVRQGQSGGISLVGTAAAMMGSIAIAGSAIPLFDRDNAVRYFAEVSACGLVGALIDSLLGATVQAQFADNEGNWYEIPGPGRAHVRGHWRIRNDWVNFLSTLAACILALLVGKV